MNYIIPFTNKKESEKLCEKYKSISEKINENSTKDEKEKASEKLASLCYKYIKAEEKTVTMYGDKYCLTKLYK